MKPWWQEPLAGMRNARDAQQNLFSGHAMTRIDCNRCYTIVSRPQTLNATSLLKHVKPIGSRFSMPCSGLVSGAQSQVLMSDAAYDKKIDDA